MFTQFYEMQEQPFGVTPDSRYLYLGHTHREALASLYCGIRDHRGFLALIAPPGYPRRLSHTADVLRQELDFIVDVDPTRRAPQVAAEFLKLINDHHQALRARYAWPDVAARLEQIYQRLAA